jgi:hypothetical protein
MNGIEWTETEAYGDKRRWMAHVESGAADAKGRAIGWDLAVMHWPDPLSSGFTAADASRPFWATTQKTKAGKRFGAGQTHFGMFATLAEAQAACEARADKLVKAAKPKAA